MRGWSGGRPTSCPSSDHPGGSQGAGSGPADRAVPELYGHQLKPPAGSGSWISKPPRTASSSEGGQKALGTEVCIPAASQLHDWAAIQPLFRRRMMTLSTYGYHEEQRRNRLPGTGTGTWYVLIKAIIMTTIYLY